MHKIVVWLLLLALICAGCASSSTSAIDQLIVEPQPASRALVPQETQIAKPRIALIMKTLTNPFFVEMERGARRAEQELGISLTVKTGAKETSIEQQIAIVKQLIRDQVDAIVIAPASSMDLVPVLVEAQKAGIVIVNIDNRLDQELSAKLGLVGVPFISVNNEHGAYLSAGTISARIDSPTQVAILEGIRSADNAQERKAGALRAFAENEFIEIVASETANWKIDEAYEVISALYNQHPEIKAIFCANDMMALGVLKFLKDTGRTDVLVAAYDALDEANAAVIEGKLLATVDQQAALQGYKGIVTALRMIQGETIPSEELVDVRLVTAETLIKE
ncbi:MAG: sugar ABC transporter substrate-binding protein [Caldilineaceae bacterium]|nr:sugar ABC transporter substrate-binding protein [Caldilineaceae bacterium]